MIFTKEDITSFHSILTTCLLGGIESIIIEDGWVKGKNPATTLIIFSNNNAPALPMKIGLSRLSELKQRFDLFASNPSIVIEAKETDRGEISSLEISAGKSKVQFRCTSTMLIKAPKNVSFTPAFKIHLSKDELKLVLSAVKIMDGKTPQVIIKKDVVEMVFLDQTNDAFTIALEAPAEVLADETTAVNYYHADTFYTVLKSAGEAGISLTLGESGAIRHNINGHAFILVPKINDTEED